MEPIRGSRRRIKIQDRSVESVRDYWDTHPLGNQYVREEDLQIGSREFFDHIRPWMNPFKFPWIMERIDQQSRLLRGKHLLEIGCGMGFDSLEFLKRNVLVTATDLTPTAVQLARRHFELMDIEPMDVREENVLDLSFRDETFDAVWANGVLHHTGDTCGALREIRRVLKPGGRAIISHFYRRPSWMYWISRLGRENIEYQEEDPPVIDFLSEAEILDMFSGYTITESYRDHYRALPVARQGVKAKLYNVAFRPVYNLIPQVFAEYFAHKFSVVAIKH